MLSSASDFRKTDAVLARAAGFMKDDMVRSTISEKERSGFELRHCGADRWSEKHG